MGWPMRASGLIDGSRLSDQPMKSAARAARTMRWSGLSRAGFVLQPFQLCRPAARREGGAGGERSQDDRAQAPGGPDEGGVTAHVEVKHDQASSALRARIDTTRRRTISVRIAVSQMARNRAPQAAIMISRGVR